VLHIHHSRRELAKETGEPTQAVIAKAIEQYRRQKFLEECHTAYCVLQQSPEAWQDYQKYLAAWDVTLMASPAYGEVWFGDLDPTIGYEHAGERPVLVLSIDAFNRSPAGLVVVLPITTRIRGIPWRVPLSPPEGGLMRPCVILCELLRFVSQQRLEGRLGTISSATLEKVQDRLRTLLNL